MNLLSICAEHSPISPEEIAAAQSGDGRLHVSADRLSQLREQASAHITTCQRGPIVAIPVAVTAGTEPNPSL